MAIFIPLYLYHSICMLSLATTSQPYKGDLSSSNGYQLHHHLPQSDHPQPSAGNTFHDFAHTSPTDEAKLRLALLVDDHIDSNKDGAVQLDELVDWISKCQDKYHDQDTNRHWSAYNQYTDARGTLGWQSYIDHEYDHLITIAKQSSDPQQVDTIQKSHEHHVKRDQRRWQAADLDSDGRLSKDEHKLFYHPENSKQMHKVLVQERFEELDTDRDGKISADEFMSNVTPDAAKANLDEHERWVSEQRVDFHGKLDTNHDNYLDQSELAKWVVDSEFRDNSITEAQHLIQAADANHDHRLTKEEILGSYHEFINSHATDFGEALRGRDGVSSHDEL